MNNQAIANPKPSHIQVTVHPIEDGQFEARIEAGWWMARGPTPLEARKKVIEKYYKELHPTE